MGLPSPKTSPVRSGCAPVTLAGEVVPLKRHDCWELDMAPAHSSFHSLRSLWPHSLSFPPPPVASPVKFLVSWEPRARGRAAAGATMHAGPGPA